MIGLFFQNIIYLWVKKRQAGVTGLEPAASGVTGQRSNQLSYTPELCQVRYPR